MTVYRRGAEKERRLMARLESAGWICYRAAGSHGNADLVALRRSFAPMLIQVKGTTAGPFAGFGPEERHDLMVEARIAGAVAVLAHWAPSKPIAWYCGPAWEPMESPL